MGLPVAFVTEASGVRAFPRHEDLPWDGMEVGSRRGSRPARMWAFSVRDGALHQPQESQLRTGPGRPSQYPPATSCSGKRLRLGTPGPRSPPRCLAGGCLGFLQPSRPPRAQGLGRPAPSRLWARVQPVPSSAPPPPTPCSPEVEQMSPVWLTCPERTVRSIKGPPGWAESETQALSQPVGTEGPLGGLCPSCLLLKAQGQGTSKTPLPEPSLVGSPGRDAGARAPDLLWWETGRPPAGRRSEFIRSPSVSRGWPCLPAHRWRGRERATLRGSPHRGQTGGVSSLCMREGPFLDPCPDLACSP